MGLKQINGRLYYYENHRQGRRVVSSYVGGGMGAVLAQERAEEEAAKRQAFERERARVAALSAQVDAAVDRLMRMAEGQLVASGFHEHKRQWRKRRMSKLAKITDKKAEQTPEIDPEREWLMLQVRAERANRDPERVPEFRAYLRDHPELHQYIKSLAAGVKDLLLEKIIQREGSRLLLETQIRHLHQELCRPKPSTAETLLVEAVLMCWLRVQYAELGRTSAMSAGTTFREIEHAEKVLTQSYSRYTRALAHLAKVQRLSLPKTETSTDKPLKMVNRL
jgi:hypothetical protein